MLLSGNATNQTTGARARNWHLALATLLGPPLAATLVVLSFVILLNPRENYLGLFWLGVAAASYAGTLLLGLPAALWLRRQNRLNGVNLFFAGWVSSFAIGSVALAYGRNTEFFLTCLLAGSCNAIVFGGGDASLRRVGRFSPRPPYATGNRATDRTR